MLNGNSMYFYVFWELIYFYVICIDVIWETTVTTHHWFSVLQSCIFYFLTMAANQENIRRPVNWRRYMYRPYRNTWIFLYRYTKYRFTRENEAVSLASEMSIKSYLAFGGKRK